MRPLGRIMLVSFVMSAVGLTARAGTATVGTHPCGDEIANFCPTVVRGDGRIRQCLKGHQAELSDGCKTQIQEHLAARTHTRRACKGDIATLCSGVERGGGRIMQCLRDHQTQLTTACAATLPQP